MGGVIPDAKSMRKSPHPPKPAGPWWTRSPQDNRPATKTRIGANDRAKPSVSTPRFYTRKGNRMSDNNGKSVLFGVLGGCAVLIVVFVLLVGGCTVLMSAGGGEEGGSNDPDTGASEEANAVPLGEAGTVGDWEVTVDSVEQQASVDDGIQEVYPSGEFEVVTLSVGNTGDEAVTFDDTALGLIDGKGNKHSASPDAASMDFFLAQINPGASVEGSVPFDVPEGTEPEKLVVEDTFSSDEPLTVNLK